MRQLAINHVPFILDAIKRSGSIPYPHLYQQLMDEVSIDEFYEIIDTLDEAGYIEQRGTLLIWAQED